MEAMRMTGAALSRRRDFLKISGLLGLSCATAALPGLARAAEAGPLAEASASFSLSGGPLHIVVYAREPEPIFEQAFREMERVARLVDPCHPGSPMETLCREGRAQGLDEDTADALAQAAGVLAIVDGPGAASGLSLHQGCACLAPDRSSCMEGLASGYVLDAGALILRKRGVRHALLSWRGSHRALGGRPEGAAWKIFAGPGKAEALLGDGGASLASDRKSPETNKPSSVMVLGPNAACAGVLARATLGKDPRAALSLYDGTPGVECLLDFGGGGLFHSRGFAEGVA